MSWLVPGMHGAGALRQTGPPAPDSVPAAAAFCCAHSSCIPTNSAPTQTVFCCSNHCLYNHDREELSARLGIRQLQQRQDGVWDAPHSYYTYRPAPGWRVICLDGYDVSILGWPSGGWAVYAWSGRGVGRLSLAQLISEPATSCPVLW